MRKSYIVILALVLSILSNIAVSADPPALKQPSSKWQLLFSIKGNLLPATYMDKSIGIQYSLASDNAIRLTFGLEYGDSSIKSIYHHDSSGIVQDYDTDDIKRDTKFAAFYLSYIKYFRHNKKIQPYYGGGPFFKYSVNNNNEEYFESTSGAPYYKSNDNTPDYSTGFILLIGVQYRISDQFQLHANYDLRFAYTRHEQNEYHKSLNGNVVTEEKNMTKSDSFDIDSDHLSLGLSVGF